MNLRLLAPLAFLALVPACTEENGPAASAPIPHAAEAPKGPPAPRNAEEAKAAYVKPAGVDTKDLKPVAPVAPAGATADGGK